MRWQMKPSNKKVLEDDYQCFFAPARYNMVKIACSYPEVVLRTIKHTMVYSGSGPSLEVIALCQAV
jgi:hypothetical protein